MTRQIPTAVEIINCRPPFSFFFDIIEKLFKAKQGNKKPLHRICTLARKQGARTIVIECAIERPDVVEEIKQLDEHYQKLNCSSPNNGKAQAIKFSFFSCDNITKETIENVNHDHFIGQGILINYYPNVKKECQHSYIYEAILPQPRLAPTEDMPRVGLLNNFITTSRKFLCYVLNCEFNVFSVYYSQQNGVTSVCAHASLKMSINSSEAIERPSHIKDLNAILGKIPPLQGLSLKEIGKIIVEHDLHPLIINCMPQVNYLYKEKNSQGSDEKILWGLLDKISSPSLKNIIIDAMEKNKDINFHYSSALAAFIESGYPALLVFDTADILTDEDSDFPLEHVVSVFGYTRNSDEWHPEALPEYAGREKWKFLPSSSWIDHFVIHDDNLGPYYTLESRALEVDPKVRAKYIIALLPFSVTNRPHFIQNFASNALSRYLKTHKSNRIKNQWIDYIIKNEQQIILRPILVTLEQYAMHLFHSNGHDGSKIGEKEITVLKKLPIKKNEKEIFWMVEISLPDLFSGNHSKVGEILLNAHIYPEKIKDYQDILIGIRLPKTFVIKDKNGGYEIIDVPLDTHSPIYLTAHAHHEW
ncbi:hypothetical protein M2352_000623 [Azospirillum fermentarium]|uniref:hypothetical protein n=1 Tax=Azospirillum fermentarium TaxID=1233114 RepID=UPI002226E4CF|nr:hypothetical protein [Azospirillum fermentarium]MCW2245032.1 hypothetical protein [Azospirillum fermentarium]